jgi:hypothetical protein
MVLLFGWFRGDSEYILVIACRRWLFPSKSSDTGNIRGIGYVGKDVGTLDRGKSVGLPSLRRRWTGAHADYSESRQSLLYNDSQRNKSRRSKKQLESAAVACFTILMAPIGSIAFALSSYAAIYHRAYDC